MFEVISSHYLELNSDKALVETDRVIAMEFEQDSKLVLHAVIVLDCFYHMQKDRCVLVDL